MFNRFGFALAILLFGGSLFGIGYLLAQQDPATLAATAGSGAAADTIDTRTDEPSGPAAEDPLPVLADLLPGLTGSDTQRYALMLGQFTQQVNAQAYGASIARVGAELAMLEVVDNQQRNWWLLITGDYSLAEANKAMYDLKALYDLRSRVIKLPAKATG